MSSSSTFGCDRVGLDFIETAPTIGRAHHIIGVSPATVYDSLLRAEDWPKWVPVITKVEWTTKPPVTVGSTRTVSMRGGLSADEEFLVAKPGEQMAFRFNAVSRQGIKAFAENYVLTELPGNRSLVEWTMALDSDGKGLPAGWIGTAMNPGLRFALGRLKKLLESR